MLCLDYCDNISEDRPQMPPFGTSAGYVIFYNSSGQASGGAPIDSWTNTEIKAKVPGIIPSNATYQVGVENSSGFKSNRISFTANAS